MNHLALNIECERLESAISEVTSEVTSEVIRFNNYDVKEHIWGRRGQRMVSAKSINLIEMIPFRDLRPSEAT